MTSGRKGSRKISAFDKRERRMNFEEGDFRSRIIEDL